MLGLSQEDRQALREIRSAVRHAFTRLRREPLRAGFEFLFHFFILTMMVGGGLGLMLLVTAILLPQVVASLLEQWWLGVILWAFLILNALAIMGRPRGGRSSPPKGGASVVELNQALIKGSTPEATEALKPRLDRLRLQ